MDAELEAVIKEVRGQTTVLFDPGWELAGAYQQMSYIVTAISTAQHECNKSDGDRRKIRAMLSAVIWFVDGAIKSLPPEE